MENEKQRERLVELLKEAKRRIKDLDTSYPNYDEAVDYLIANGVKLSEMCCECKYFIAVMEDQRRV